MLGKETFSLNKGQYTEKLGKIIINHRVNGRVIGEPAEFVLRSCRLTEQWVKLGNDPEVKVYLRNIDIAGGRKVKMISLERGSTKQPVPMQKLIDVLYPPKKISTSATPEEKHFNMVKASMRNAVSMQLKAYRDGVRLPYICPVTDKKIRPGMKADVDHIGMPFSEIADRFVSSKLLKYTDIALKGPPTGKVFTDATLWQEWVHFHLAHARYALVCASANRSKGSNGYQTNPDIIGSFAAETEEDLSLDF
jgi:hypothetical protein